MTATAQTTRCGFAAIVGEKYAVIDPAAQPKPADAPFRAFVEKYGVAPKSALMVEDMAKNLAPAHALGMSTAWVRTGIDWAEPVAGTDHIHYIVEDLAGFLVAAAGMEPGDERSGNDRTRTHY